MHWRARGGISSPLRTRHRRFPPPTRKTGTRALLRRRRSLDRAHAVWRWRWRWRSLTPRVTHITRARAHVITAHRARHHPPHFPMSPMRARGSSGGAVSFARLLARAEAEGWDRGRRSVTSRVTRVKHVTRVARHARARAYHHCFARVITVFRPPRARPARARCCGGGARSLARSLDRAHAVWRWRWRWRSVTPRVTLSTRVRVHVIAAHHARHHNPPSPMSPMRARGSSGGAFSFARLLARARWPRRWGWGRRWRLRG